MAKCPQRGSKSVSTASATARVVGTDLRERLRALPPSERAARAGARVFGVVGGVSTWRSVGSEASGLPSPTEAIAKIWGSVNPKRSDKLDSRDAA